MSTKQAATIQATNQFKTTNNKIVPLGSVTTDTLRYEVTIPALYSTLEDISVKKARKIARDYSCIFTARGQYRAALTSSINGLSFREIDGSILGFLLDDLQTALNDLIPSGTPVYFGTLEGDGADLGYFIDHDQLEEGDY